jgi:hypothetical protein
VAKVKVVFTWEREIGRRDTGEGTTAEVTNEGRGALTVERDGMRVEKVFSGRLPDDLYEMMEGPAGEGRN